MAEKKKKARGGTYKEYAEFQKSTRPVTIADMVPVKGKVMEAGVGGARKAAVAAARKLMQKTKGAEKARVTKGVDKATKESKRFERSLTDDDKALMELAEMTAKPKKLTPSARAKNAARAKSEGFKRMPPASRKDYAEEIESLSKRYGGMDSLDDLGRVLKGHGIKFRRVGDELLIAEKVSKKFPTEMFSVKSGDAARVIQYLGY